MRKLLLSKMYNSVVNSYGNEYEKSVWNGKCEQY